MELKETIVNECLKVLHREDVKEEFKELMRPLIDMLIKEIYPYIFLSIIFVFISFLLFECLSINSTIELPIIIPSENEAI